MSRVLVNSPIIALKFGSPVLRTSADLPKAPELAASGHPGGGAHYADLEPDQRQRPEGFSQSLNHVLNVLADQLAGRSDRAVVSTRSVMATARAAIAQYSGSSGAMDRPHVHEAYLTLRS